MKIFSSLLIASTLFTMSFTGGATPEVNHRPYISTRLAKVIMSEDEEVIEEKCDGSGWITHGDGHKTECPGCSACQDKIKPEPDPDIKPSSVCQCGCEREGCNCQQTGECFPLPEQEPLKKNDSNSSQESLNSLEEEQEYNIYHFGAKWCAPCEQMKKQTWASSRVKKAIEDTEAKLFIFDEANPEHKKFFFYYKVKRYPTVIFVDKDDLNNPLHRVSGFVDANKMTETIKEKLND